MEVPMVMDCRGMACPKPVIKVAIKARDMPQGSLLEVRADCQSFKEDLSRWCDDTGNVLINLIDKGDHRVATIQF